VDDDIPKLVEQFDSVSDRAQRRIFLSSQTQDGGEWNMPVCPRHFAQLRVDRIEGIEEALNCSGSRSFCRHVSPPD